MQEGSKEANKQWGKDLSQAKSRIHAWKARVRECERARDEAVRMLEDCADRMRAMIDRGEIGTRKGVDDEEYPQMRVMYWGEIENGTMSMLCLEVDYGQGDKARVGAWAKTRALWDFSALSWGERFEAWRRSFSQGSPAQSERVWSQLRASLRALSSELELDLDFGAAREAPASKGTAGLDEREWEAWIARQGESLVRLGLPLSEASEEAMPTEAEWLELEREAQMLLDKVVQGLGAGAKRAPPEAE